MAEEHMADMGKFVVAKEPDILVCLGLGSCVGVGLIDEASKIGGMSHVMLPKSDESKAGSSDYNEDKFADKAIPHMITELKKKGADITKLKAKIAGGAHMFKNMIESESLDIGKRNAEAVKKILSDLKIPLKAEQVGGDLGRTIRFDLSNGKFIIKTKNGIEEI